MGSGLMNRFFKKRYKPEFGSRIKVFTIFNMNVFGTPGEIHNDKLTNSISCNFKYEYYMN